MASESSPSKRHSFPAILSYSETLSVLSEHQRQYNDKEITRNAPSLNAEGTKEERKQKLQEAVEWIKVELKDMYHQDKFLLRQFNHLNRTIQELKEKKELKEEAEAKEAKQFEKEELQQVQTKQNHGTTPQFPKQAQLTRQNQKEEKYTKVWLKKYEVGQQGLKEEKASLNEYDSDYGSDQSVDKFEDECETLKHNVIVDVTPKITPKQRGGKRWTWWK